MEIVFTNKCYLFNTLFYNLYTIHIQLYILHVIGKNTENWIIYTHSQFHAHTQKHIDTDTDT